MSAVISPCGTYRYRLERRDLFAQTMTAIVMVNPSTADATEDDATIRRVIGFRDRKGWGHVVVGNLFAFRATDVRELARASDPVGPDNDDHLRQMIAEADRVVVAWGRLSKQPKDLRDRWRVVAEIAQPLGKTLMSIGQPATCGHPCHPLMLPYTRELQPWRLG